MSNAGLKLREPVIGDEFDLQTYGRPSGRTRRAAPRANAPAKRAPVKRAPVYDSGRSRIDADGVRTVRIRGQATPPRRRAPHGLDRPLERYDAHPDRAAQWALFLGVFMVILAIVTGT